MGWHQCSSCIFGSNSAKQATQHETATGHETKEEQE